MLRLRTMGRAQAALGCAALVSGLATTAVVSQPLTVGGASPVLVSLPCLATNATNRVPVKLDDVETASTVYPSAKIAYPNIPWPLPAYISTGNLSVTLSAHINLSCGAGVLCDATACASGSTMLRALKRYVSIFSPPRSPPPSTAEVIVKTIEVCIHKADEALGPDMNESYALKVPSKMGEAILISSESQFGALRALESLAHLLSISRPGRILNTPVQIRDSPRWSTRGLMVNPAGRYMSVEFLKHIVDGLVVNKMNCTLLAFAVGLQLDVVTRFVFYELQTSIFILQMSLLFQYTLILIRSWQPKDEFLAWFGRVHHRKLCTRRMIFDHLSRMQRTEA